jgi:hypothetical protein
VGRIDFSVWHALVAGTSLLAAVLLVRCPRLRLQSAAVLVSGFVWAAMFLVALPALTSRGGGEHDLGSAVGNSVLADGCGLLLAAYHLLLCVALSLAALRACQPATDLPSNSSRR